LLGEKIAGVLFFYREVDGLQQSAIVHERETPAVAIVSHDEKKPCAANPASTASKLILDDHSAQISMETKAWLATQPEGGFIFVFTPRPRLKFNLKRRGCLIFLNSPKRCC
jgi:hypothetical protein